MIIVEGADLVGKSTLCKAIINELRLRGMNYAHCHLGRLAPGDRENEYYVLMRRYQVWDRFHLSEVAYRACDDVEPCITANKFRRVDKYARENYGALIVVVLASDNLIRERHAKSGDDVYSLEHILKVNTVFQDIVSGPVNVRGETYVPHIDLTVVADDIVDDLDHSASQIVSYYLERA